MNKQERDVLNALLNENYNSQRILSESCGHSLGVINRSIKNLTSEGYLDKNINLTEKAKKEFKEKAPKNAIILAAGFGMRMVPINTEIPKGLIEVNGEVLIERLIRQLHEVGIFEIYIVVGFMKERYEYLIDEYSVKLIVNSEYSEKNNLSSMKLVTDYLSNTYIMPCDVWCEKNPFRKNELYSWYMVSDLIDDDSDVRVNRKRELVKVSESIGGNAMIGISYLLEEDADFVRDNINRMSQNEKYKEAFWEEALYNKEKMIIQARVVQSSDYVEINTYEQLRELDSDSNHLKSNAIKIICQVLNVDNNEITDITVLKKGMTNRSFLFTCREQKFIMRIPGEGTDMLINREEEASVYEIIQDKQICDDILYINSKNGYKITKFLDNARVCDPYIKKDTIKCIRRLREFHKLKLQVEHEFDIFKQIDFYENLWKGEKSGYKDYLVTKKKIMSLKTYIQKYAENKVLTHIDAVPDNFLFIINEKGEEEIRLIDWEYAGMQDPHVDIAMFCIYSLYNKDQIDWVIQEYFEGNCNDEIRIKIYCYIAVCGLLWSNWCEYKRNLGVDFGEYSLRQYRYAKDYYKIVQEELEKRGINL